MHSMVVQLRTLQPNSSANFTLVVLTGDWRSGSLY